MTKRDGAISAGGVQGGRLDAAGEQALLEFEGEGGPIRLALPVGELTALLSVCIGLVGQGLPQDSDAEHPTIPVSDWRVGVSERKAVVLALAPEAGGALAFHLSAQQAESLASALLRGVEFAQGAAGERALRRH